MGQSSIYNKITKNVLKSNGINLFVGGVNYFPYHPNENNLLEVNKLLPIILSQNKIKDDLYKVDIDTLFLILDRLGNYISEDWDKEKFIYSIQALQSQRPSFKIYILIKTGRELTRATGSMLSESDRKLGDKYPNDLFVIIHYINSFF